MLYHNALLLVLLAPLVVLSTVDALYVPRHRNGRSQTTFKAAQDKLLQSDGVTFADSYHGTRVLKMSKAERWSLVTSLKALTEKIKLMDKNTETYHAHRWNLPLYKRLHNCILASLSEIDDYSGILLHGKSPRDHMQKDKGFSTCTDAELDIVIGVGSPFEDVLDGNAEAIWASSTIETYEQLDHTFLYSSSMLDAISLYEQFPSLVKVVLSQGDDLQKCVAYNAPGKEILLSEEDVVLGGKTTGYQFDSLVGTRTVRISKEELSNNDRDPLSTELRDDYQVRPYGYKALAPISGSHRKRTYPATCVRRNDSDSGIPIWKLFEWQPKDAVSVHPLGHQFTVSPHRTASSSRMPSSQNIHLGVSLEGRCGKALPNKTRFKQVYLAAEDTDQLERIRSKYMSDTWTRLGSEFDVEFVASAGLGGSGGDNSITNLGNMGKRAQRDEIRHSRVFLDLRPRPLDHGAIYEALCMGLPVVYLRSSVAGTALADLAAPYAYSIAGDPESLAEALHTALQNPISPYLAPIVTKTSNEARHELLVTTEWNQVVRGDANLRSIVKVEGFDI